MSGFDDCPDEMLRRDGLSDQTIEAVFRGHAPEGTDVGWLVSLVEDARLATSGPPPRVGGELTSVFTAGISTEKGELPVTAASNATGPAVAQASGLPKWRSIKMSIASALGALFTKIAALGGVAKAGLAVASVAAVTAVGGAGGVLPGPAQDAFDDVVGSETEIVSETDKPDDTDKGADFGATVSEDAQDGGVDGQQVSEDARETFQPETPAGPPASLPVTPPAPPAPADSGPPEGTPSGPPAGAGRP